MSITKDFVVKQGVTIQGTATSLSTSTGALLVAGGAGIAGSVFASGIGSFGANTPGTATTSTTTSQTLRITSGGAGVVGDSLFQGQVAIAGSTYILGTAPASTTNTGALQVLGGVGIGGAVYIGTSSYIAGSQILTQATLGALAVTSIIGGTDTNVSSSTGAVTVWSTATLASVSGRSGPGYAAGVTPNAITIQNYTGSVSTNSGALIVTGGVGIWNTLTVGGAANITGIINGSASLSIATTASFGGTANATNTFTGAVVMVGGLAVAQTVYSQGHVVVGTNASVSTTASNALVVSQGGLGVQGTALIGGNTVLQSPTNGTSTGTGQALLVAGGVGVAANLVAGKVITADQTAATSGGAGSLQIAGGAYVANNIYVGGGTQSTGTQNGSLVVSGGVGISQNLNVGGTAYITGDLYVDGTNFIVNKNIIATGDSTLTLSTGSTSSVLATGAGLQIGNTATPYISWLYDGIGNWKSSGGIISSSTIYASSGSLATNTLTGAIQVLGGVGINGNIYVAGNGASASSSSVASQSIVINTNGIGVTGNSYFASNVGIGGAYGLGVTNNIGVGNQVIISGTSAVGSTSSISSQALVVTANGMAINGASNINGALSISGLTQITNTTNSTAFGNGALTVLGGVGIAQNLTVGGTIFGNLTGVATTATNIAGGATGSIPYQTTAGNTAFIGIGQAGFLLVSNGSSATWSTATSIPVGIALDAINIAVTGTNASTPYYLAMVQAVNPANYFEPVYSTSTVTITPQTGVASFSGTVDSTTSTNGTIVTTGGVGIAKSTVVGGTSTHYGPVVILNNQSATTATSTASSAALQIAGGASVQGSIYAGNIYDNNNRVITSVTPTASTGIAITSLVSSGPAVSFTINNFGVTSLAGTTYLGVSSNTGSVTLTNLGVQTLTAGTDTAVSASTGTITIWNTATLQTITNRGNSTTNAVYITNGTQAGSTGTGALTVQGGAGIGGNLYVGATLNRSGNVSSSSWLASGVAIVSSTATFTDTVLTGPQGPVAINAFGVPTLAATNTPVYSDAATVYIAGAPSTSTGVSVTNPWSLLIPNGNVKFGATATSVSTATGALVVGGGIGAGGAGYFGGLVQAGATVTATSVVGFVSNNATIATYTSGVISTTTQQTLDVWSSSTYRTARYTIQVVDTGFTPNYVYNTEMMIFHDGAGTVYKSEYGMTFNGSILGNFDVNMIGQGVQLVFTPTYTPANMTIKAHRTTLSL